ncbi:MAG: EF-P lysine aminoacylase EpmA [Halioglobus sp.]
MSHWQPNAALATLEARAALYQEIRQYFTNRGVLEVETPLLCSSGITDPFIEPLLVESGYSVSQSRYLQTSPEYAMKRLLAAGSGPIYQIARAFRDGEVGRRHNPEFTLLEWYQPGFDHHQLMDQVADLVGAVLNRSGYEKLSYRQLFLEVLDLDPLTCEIAELEARVRAITDPGDLRGNRDCWLNLLLTHEIEPSLGGRGMVFVYDYPASQAALARVDMVDGVNLARRFELYVDGLELANGYFELTDAGEQRSRFERDNEQRTLEGIEPRPLDEKLLAAMVAGIPDCSGVALGLDRLLMLREGLDDISQTLSFSWDRC